MTRFFAHVFLGFTLAIGFSAGAACPTEEQLDVCSVVPFGGYEVRWEKDKPKWILMVNGEATSVSGSLGTVLVELRKRQGQTCKTIVPKPCKRVADVGPMTSLHYIMQEDLQFSAFFSYDSAVESLRLLREFGVCKPYEPLL